MTFKEAALCGRSSTTSNTPNKLLTVLRERRDGEGMGELSKGTQPNRTREVRKGALATRTSRKHRSRGSFPGLPARHHTERTWQELPANSAAHRPASPGPPRHPARGHHTECTWHEPPANSAVPRHGSGSTSTTGSTCPSQSTAPLTDHSPILRRYMEIKSRVK